MFIFLKRILLMLSLSSLSVATIAQTVHEPGNSPSDWSKPFPPFQIVGNLYWVGTYDLGCYLIVTPQGNILINTGLANSGPLIKSSIEALGFKLSDTKILLTTQAHYDHMGSMAEIKKQTNAKLLVNEKDAGVAADGGRSDYAFGGESSTFAPVKPDGVLHDKDTIKLGNTAVVMLHHPGHTKGSCSYMMEIKDNQKSYKVLIANLPTIVTEKNFADVTVYPGIEADYAYTFNALKNLSFDIWLASHANQFALHQKYKPGDAYNPTVFMDRKGYDTSVNNLENLYLKKIGKK